MCNVCLFLYIPTTGVGDWPAQTDQTPLPSGMKIKYKDRPLVWPSLPCVINLVLCTDDIKDIRLLKICTTLPILSGSSVEKVEEEMSSSAQLT